MLISDGNEKRRRRIERTVLILQRFFINPTLEFHLKLSDSDIGPLLHNSDLYVLHVEYAVEIKVILRQPSPFPCSDGCSLVLLLRDKIGGEKASIFWLAKAERLVRMTGFENSSRLGRLTSTTKKGPAKSGDAAS